MNRAMTDLITLCRPKQWIKNSFVLVGLLFAGRWDADSVLAAAVLFVAFCLASSSVYIVNDLEDVASDRRHPVKRNRPIARGAVSTGVARTLALGFAALALSGAWMVSTTAAGLVAAYLALSIAYTKGLKQVVIVDVFVIAAGFMLRMLAGTLGLDIEPSSWMLICGMMLTLFLGFAKRRAEMLLPEGRDGTTRAVLTSYSPRLLDQYLAISASATILAYALYSVSEASLARYGPHGLMWTVPFVLYGILRYLHILHEDGRGESAANDLLDDPHLLITVIAWAATVLWIVLI